jgi:hypothetical protein
MSDPRFDYDRGIPRGTPPGDPVMHDKDPVMHDKSAWLMGGLVGAVLVLGLIFFYSTSGDTPKTVGTSPSETTGQSERVTPPANPNATEPQRDPPRTQSSPDAK